MSKATEALLEPLVAEGLAIRDRLKAAEKIRAEKAEELKKLDEGLKAIEAELAAVNARLIERGGGRYCDEAQHVAIVVTGIAPQPGADKFALPDGALETAKTLAGEHFKKLFERTEVFAPKNGVDALADLLLTSKKARDLVSLLLVPGKPMGGRAAYVKWS